MFHLAHLTDLHLPPLPAVRARDLANKRVLGYLSWQHKRKHEHRSEVVAALRRDLDSADGLPAWDHLAVTGDLTNLGLPAEYRAAAAWLDTLGSPASISVVPGNHDAYIATARAATHDHWAPWTTGDDHATGGAADGTADSTAAGYPYLRRRGPLSLIGVSTAVPTRPFFASGRIGPGQLQRLDALLRHEGAAGRTRVVLIHHPPQPGVVGVRKGLGDAPALRAVLAEAGADLILHGHLHIPMRHTLPGPHGDIPVLGAGSASALGHHGRPPAQYHRLAIGPPSPGQPVQARVVSRGYDAARDAFVTLEETRLTLPAS